MLNAQSRHKSLKKNIVITAVVFSMCAVGYAAIGKASGKKTRSGDSTTTTTTTGTSTGTTTGSSTTTTTTTDTSTSTTTSTTTTSSGTPTGTTTTSTDTTSGTSTTTTSTSSTDMGSANIALPDLSAPGVTSRTSCVAPCAVFFDVSGTTSALTSLPFHELLFQWDFGDPIAGGAGTCVDSNPQPREAGQGSYCTGVLTGSAKLDSKNFAEGPEAAHVFENAGTYTATVIVSQGDINANGVLDSSEYKKATVTITVAAADTEWAGTKTICFSTSGTFTGCPSGAYQVVYTAQTDFTSLLAANRRYLFRRGETFATSTPIRITQNGPGMIGAFGSGAKPVFSHSGGGGFSLGNSSPGAMSDWRIVDIAGVGINGGSDNGAFSSAASYFSNLLLLRVDVSNLIMFTSSGSTLGSTTSNVWDGLFIADSTLRGVWSGSCPSCGDNGIYLTGTRVAAIGNHIDMNKTGEHALRSYAQRIVFSHNTIEDVARTGITMRSFSWAGGGGLPAYTYSGKAVLAQNRVFNVAASIGGGPTNQSTDDRSRDLIFERNLLDKGMGFVAVQYATARNNLLSSTTNDFIMLVQGMDPGVGQCPTNIFVYGNSAYFGGTYFSAIANFTQIPPECTSLPATIRNNLMYTPSDNVDATVSDLDSRMAVTSCSTCNTQSNGEKRTTPLYAANPPTTAGGFALGSGSYAKGRGVVVPVWNDFYGNWQPAARNVGAMAR